MPDHRACPGHPLLPFVLSHSALCSLPNLSSSFCMKQQQQPLTEARAAPQAPVAGACPCRSPSDLDELVRFCPSPTSSPSSRDHALSSLLILEAELARCCHGRRFKLLHLVLPPRLHLSPDHAGRSSNTTSMASPLPRLHPKDPDAQAPRPCRPGTRRPRHSNLPATQVPHRWSHVAASHASFCSGLRSDVQHQVLLIPCIVDLSLCLDHDQTHPIGLGPCSYFGV